MVVVRILYLEMPNRLFLWNLERPPPKNSKFVNVCDNNEKRNSREWIFINGDGKSALVLLFSF